MGTMEQINEIATALVAAQAEMKNAIKDSTNPHFKSSYADIASVIDSIRGPLTKNGLAFTQIPKLHLESGEWTLVTKLLHKSGQTLENECPIIVAKDDAQGFGSALTYARRYGLQALTGQAADDDDGNLAAKNPPAEKPKDKPAAKAPAPKESDPVSKYQIDQLMELTDKKGIPIARMQELLKLMGLTKSVELTQAQFKKVYSVISNKGIDEAFVEFQKEPPPLNTNEKIT
jgi:hypothetical protein